MQISPAEFVEKAQKTPVLDVRSPGEYKKGHIPGAISFPLFTNGERAEIGTMYKQVGRDEAFERGLELVGPKIKDMLVEAKAHAKDGKLLVHCWRGGMRSESVANLLNMSGLKTEVLVGGYKAFRNWALSLFTCAHNFRVIGGMTGANKTGILKALADLGEATVDLENLAGSKGSSFGAMDKEAEVTQAQFENEFAMELSRQRNKTVWLEDESRKIGSLTIPGPIWEKMVSAPFFYVEISKNQRIQHLISGYGDYSIDQLRSAILRIRSRLGGLRTSQALEFLIENRAEELADLLLDYYDKAYARTMENRKSEKRITIYGEGRSASEIATELQLRTKIL